MGYQLVCLLRRAVVRPRKTKKPRECGADEARSGDVGWGGGCLWRQWPGFRRLRGQGILVGAPGVMPRWLANYQGPSGPAQRMDYTSTQNRDKLGAERSEAPRAGRGAVQGCWGVGPGDALKMRRTAGRYSDAGGVASALRDLRRFGRMSRSGEMRRREFVAGTGARNERRSRTQSLDKPGWAVGGVAGDTPAEGVAAHEVAARGRLPPPRRGDRRKKSDPVTCSCHGVAP